MYDLKERERGGELETHLPRRSTYRVRKVQYRSEAKTTSRSIPFPFSLTPFSPLFHLSLTLYLRTEHEYVQGTVVSSTRAGRSLLADGELSGPKEIRYTCLSNDAYKVELLNIVLDRRTTVRKNKRVEKVVDSMLVTFIRTRSHTSMHSYVQEMDYLQMRTD